MHAKHMETALKIAFDRMGATSPNPPVGAVIVRNGSVVATGGTGPCGSDHAEVVALSRAGGECAGADMYVSLEPCSHYGRTPPCTEAIKRAGIARVFVPALDPNPIVSGRGIADLSRAGIDVVLMEEMAEHAIELIRPFKKYILRHRPFVVSKSAVTLDGRIATKTGDSRWISSEYSRCLAHRLRAKVDAVMIGKNTFTRDNPALNVRLSSFGDDVSRFFRETVPKMIGRENFFLKLLASGDVTALHDPLRVVVGLPGDIDMASKVMADGNYLFFERSEAVDRLVREHRPLARAIGAINLHRIEADSPDGEARAISEELARRGIMFVMLEGGGRLAGSFLDAGEIDQFIYVIAPKIAGNGLPPLAGSGVDAIADAMALKDVSVMPLKEDIVYTGYREQYHFETM